MIYLSAYRPIKARSYAAMAVAQAGGLDIKQVIPDMAALKPELPFGQVTALANHLFSESVAYISLLQMRTPK